MRNTTPADLEGLVHEALARLGWKADPVRAAARAWRLDIGMPGEDEFSAVCRWLGQCELVQKLDQKQVPAEPSQRYQVPSLLTVFRVADRSIPALIEVRTSRDNVLAIQPDYFERLSHFAELLKLPLLIAWKHLGIWTLFEWRHMRKADTNMTINFESALRENLLGAVAGDFSYSVHTAAGLHLKMRGPDTPKAAPADRRGERGKMICEEVYFTDGQGQVLRDLEPTVQSLFLTWNLSEEEERSNNQVVVHHLVREYAPLFAHMVLVRLLDLHVPAGDAVDWKALLAESEILSGVGRFDQAIRTATDRRIVRTVLHQVPYTKPDFLPAR